MRDQKERRQLYVVRNDDEGWTYVGYDSYYQCTDFLSAYAQRFAPGVQEMDIVIKSYVAGKEGKPFLVGILRLDRPMPDPYLEGMMEFASTDFSKIFPPT